MDEAQLYPIISKSIVKIAVGNSFHHGYVSRCQQHSAIVVGSSINFPKPLENFEVGLGFPDGKKHFPEKKDVEIVGNIAIIKCHFSGDGINTNMVQPLTLSMQPLMMSEQIYTYSAYRGYTGVITPGFITELHDDNFHHNCSAAEMSHVGALVINKRGELVGLCYDFKRYLISMNVQEILLSDLT